MGVGVSGCVGECACLYVCVYVQIPGCVFVWVWVLVHEKRL